MDARGPRHVGARLLGEVEEGSLEELLSALRESVESGAVNYDKPPPLHLPIAELSAIISRYQRATQSIPPPLMSVSGRYLPLLYHIISTLISAPHNYTVVIVDTEGKFDVTCLVRPSPPPSTELSSGGGGNQEKGTTATATHHASYPATLDDLEHVHIYRPPQGPEHIRAALDAADEFMLYGRHESRGRDWWGTIVIGGGGGGGGSGGRHIINAGWKGWLRVERKDISGFAAGISVEEALRERDRRQVAVDAAGWVASSHWGTYVWRG